MSQISKAVLGTIAITLTLGAVQIASGHDLVNRWQAVSEQPSHIVRHSGKADRLAAPKPFSAPTKTVSLRLNDLADTSVLLRIPSAQARTTKPPVLLRNQSRKPTLACEPVVSALTAITLIHGCCLTGKTWETTPDGRMGWDEYFVRHSHPTYVVDQVWRGRSAADPSAINAVRSGKAAVDQLPTVFSAGHEGAWAIFRFGKEYPQTMPGMRFPLAAQTEFWKQMVPDSLNSLPTPNPTVPALSELAQKIGGTVLMSHSQSGIYPFQTAVLSRKGIAGIVSIEPGACPLPTDDMAPYADLPILVLFGDYVDEFPRWAPRLKNCRAFIAAANAAGGKAELLVLPDIGIKGNTHMLMQDDNSLDIADILLDWIGKHVAAAGQ